MLIFVVVLCFFAAVLAEKRNSVMLELLYGYIE